MKRKKLTIALVASTLALVLMLTTLSVYAYFSTQVYVYTDTGREVAKVGMNLQLLFGKLTGVAEGTDLKIPSYNVVGADGTVVKPANKSYWANVAGEGQYLHFNDGATDKTTYDPSAPWGSAQNPYVISEARHMQNLSALQSVGYFDLLYIRNNFKNGAYAAGSASIPYFVVCNVDGTPVTIDGSDLDPIKPIGSAEHPFIGVIGGAFAAGETTVAEKTSSVSAIHGFKIQTNTNQTDVGLFGYVGFLGKEPTEEEVRDYIEDDSKYVPHFEGVFSSVQNVLLSDVTVTVDEPGLDEKISELFMPFWEKFFGDGDGQLENGEVLHRFSYADVSDTVVPHETHHIGIFAGHVSYALIDKINVYYSNDQTYAIDLTHTKANPAVNYYTSSGILGMIYNMNCTIQNVYDKDADGNVLTTIGGNCIVKMGTGTSNDEVGSNGPGTGTGTGGGELSGSGRGYVTAAEIFDTYNFKEAGDSMNEMLWKYTIVNTTDGVVTNVENAILIYKKTDGTYTLADGTTPATVSNGSVSANGGTWQNFLVRVEKTGEAVSSKYVYCGEDGQTEVESYEMQGSRQHGQQIWRYQAGADGVWRYGVLLHKSSAGQYTLGDNTVVTVANGVATRASDGATWTDYIVEIEVDGDTVCYDSSEKVLVSTYNRKPMLIYGAENEEGESLCQRWYRETLWSSLFGAEPEATDMYYFYDGVFTFALSSMDDTIEDTWENNEAPEIYLGADDPNKWVTNYESGNKAIIAFLKLVEDNATLDQAIDEGKQIIITARPDLQNVNNAYLMSLIKGTSSDAADDPITSLMVPLDSATGDTVKQSYQGGEFTTMPIAPYMDGKVSKERPMFYKDQNGNMVTMTVNDLLDSWNEYTILNIGRTGNETTLETIKKQYNIAAGEGSKMFYTLADGTVVENPTADGYDAYYDPWDGYYFYVVNTETTYDWIFPTGRKHTFNLYYQPPNNGEPILIGTSTQNTDIDTNNQFNYNLAGATPALSTLIRAAVEGTGDTATPIIVNGEDMYNGYISNGAWVTTANLPLLDLTASAKFYDSGTTAYVNGSKVTKKTGDQVEAFIYYNVAEDEYRDQNGNSMTKGQGQASTLPVLYEYKSYQFSDVNVTSYLSILKRATREVWGGWYGEGYEIWAGSDSNYSSLPYEQGLSRDGVLVFKDGKCYLQYTYGTVSRYVNISNASGNYVFGTADNNINANTQLYVYVVEGMLDMDYGTHTFIPDDHGQEGSTSVKFEADEYVFWPQTTLKQNGTYKDNGLTLVEGTTENAQNVQTTDPVYKVIPLVGNNGLNWVNKNGVALGSDGYGYGLTQKFKMADQAGFGPMLNLLNANIAIEGEYSQLVAPVGSDGVETVIPKGCVAFRVNTVTDNSSIRVIVAVPTSSYYVTGYDTNGNPIVETGFDLDLQMDYYIGMWQVPAVGDNVVSQFSKADAVEKFELPRSYSFDFASDPSDVEAPQGVQFKNYQYVQYNGSTYRTYLNGDTILVAYEFKVSEVGVYVIGSAHGNADTVSDFDCPMEIVHFSVSGAASAGRDGVTGNQLGAIDFVYDDTEGNIATIDKTGSQTGPTNGTEYYTNYYASHCLLYSNNTQKVNGNFVQINQEKVKIRRYVDNPSAGNAKTVLACQIEGSVTDAFLIKQYSLNTDEVIQTPTPQPTQ